jgi:hypothetical protein
MEDGPTKVLLYTHHGFGKTYQCRYYQEVYGKGLILSGESGLKSLEDVKIDYLPFTSWDGSHDPEEGVYSFRGIVKMLQSPAFKEAGYKWIAIDSLTEMSDRLMEKLERDYRDEKNGFAMWGEYSRLMMGALKWVRDLPMHVYVTALAMDETDDNDKTHYWPHVHSKKLAKQVPGLFDHVLCGLRETVKDADGTAKVHRSFVTDQVNGWHGKVRDPLNRIRAVEKTARVTDLLLRMEGKLDDPETTKAKGE